MAEKLPGAWALGYTGWADGQAWPKAVLRRGKHHMFTTGSRALNQLGLSRVAVFGLALVLEQQRYDVVFLDVQMPEMDGLAAAREICARWLPERRPRMIAMTANAMVGDREACLSAGMHDYVSKPVQPSELEAALRRAIIDVREREWPMILAPSVHGRATGARPARQAQAT